MKLYQIFLICLLFTYISSSCQIKDKEGSSLEECSKRELDKNEGAACCFVEAKGQINAKDCMAVDQDKYDSILKGKNTEEKVEAQTTLTYYCAKEKESSSSSSANNLALSLLILLFFTLL